MASTSSTPSQSTHKWTYDVFLSFRGEDTRKTFVGHLHDWLQLKGIHTFIDDERLEKGKCITPSLLQAIQESRFAIVVFSANYASSTWCLDEVAKIMECNEKLDQTVIPVFYDVEPTQVRKQTETFAKSLVEHKEKFKDDEAKVQRWRKALTEAANIAGHDLHGDKYKGHEHNCIKAVVDDILAQLRPASPVLEENLVGLESQLEAISTLLGVPFKDDVKFIGIWGMGGIGKTTIARAAFVKFSNRFERACILYDIREKHNKHGLEALQATLLSELLKEKSVPINNEHEGIQMIKERLRRFRVLIILDDVDHLEQLKKLVGDGDWFHKGSKVIITTRDRALFRSFRVVECYEVHKLANDEALKLFSWHAFKRESPRNGFEDLSRSIVSYASGLPLALKVLGSFLCGRPNSEWRSTLKKIKGVPDKEVLTKLRISFDGLDDGQKKTFLHIACFFRKMKRDYVEDVLKSCDVHPGIEIPVLIERSLIFESDGYIDMHDLIQEMGWYIERENPRSRSRIWQIDDLDNVELEAVEVLFVTFRDRYHYNGSNSRCIKAFKRMKNLRVFIVDGCNPSKISRFLSKIKTSMSLYNYLPSSLRWLDLTNYPLCSLPKSFHPSNLVGFRLRYSSIQSCSTAQNLNKLTCLDLSFSSLLKTPNFRRMPNLKSLYLTSCANLKEIHPSIGLLKELVLLDLKSCTNLEVIPDFTQVSSLKSFKLGYCLKLEKFPEIQASTPDLRELHLPLIGIRELPSSIQQLHGLTTLCLSCCENLVCLSGGLCELTTLKVLKLISCPKLKSLPENLGNLSQLEKLHVEETAILRLPSSIIRLSSIEYLSFGCSVFPRTLEVVVPSVSGLCLLKRLELCHLDMRDEGLPKDFGCLTSLEYLNLRGNRFVRLPESFSQLPRLQYLDIRRCEELEELPELPATIRELYAECRSAVKSNIAELATKSKYSELYLVSLSGYIPQRSAERESRTYSTKFIHFSGSCVREIPFGVFYRPAVIGTSTMKRCFEYEGRRSNKISIDLNPSWYRPDFVGFVVCCDFPLRGDLWDGDRRDRLEHYGITAKLAHKDNGNEVLQAKCVISTSAGIEDFFQEGTCFAYMPFSSLWPESKTKTDGVTPNDYSIFEAAFMDLEVSAAWGCSLLYKDGELIIKEIPTSDDERLIEESDDESLTKESDDELPT